MPSSIVLLGAIQIIVLEASMSYQSIDALQEALSTGVFRGRKDSRKAAGRALGTILELITYYLIKDYGLLHNICIERPLGEFANGHITHNVEFTLHGSTRLASVSFLESDSLTPSRVKRLSGLRFDGYDQKSNNPFRKGIIKNSATLFESPRTIVNAYVDTRANTCSIYELDKAPCAMFECKRVGVEQGMSKGPQTIEKAKQGAYVSRVVSKLQRIRRLDGSMAGVIELPDGSFAIDDYDSLLAKMIRDGDPETLRDIVLTVGVISDHGNWFTRDNQNKETMVLSQSYDWLLFLTDEGLAGFISDAILGNDPTMKVVSEAFMSCYDDAAARKTPFTKSSLPACVDAALTEYFHDNRARIASWFNVLTPESGTVEMLMKELKDLIGVRWEEVAI